MKVVQPLLDKNSIVKQAYHSGSLATTCSKHTKELSEEIILRVAKNM